MGHIRRTSSRLGGNDQSAHQASELLSPQTTVVLGRVSKIDPLETRPPGRVLASRGHHRPQRRRAGRPPRRCDHHFRRDVAQQHRHHRRPRPTPRAGHRCREHPRREGRADRSRAAGRRQNRPSPPLCAATTPSRPRPQTTEPAPVEAEPAGPRPGQPPDPPPGSVRGRATEGPARVSAVPPPAPAPPAPRPRTRRTAG